VISQIGCAGGSEFRAIRDLRILRQRERPIDECGIEAVDDRTYTAGAAVAYAGGGRGIDVGGTCPGSVPPKAIRWPR